MQIPAKTNLILLKIMRCTVFLLLLHCFCDSLLLAHPAAGQDMGSVRISLFLKNEPLTKAFSVIEAQSNYKFVYDPALVDRVAKVNLQVKDQALDVVLAKLLEGTPLFYQILNNKILIQQKPKTSAAKSPAAGITGKVTDAQTGEPLPGVNVLLKGTNLGTTTDSEGVYSIMVADENGMLIFSYIGYNPQEVPVAGRSEINVSLVPGLQTLNQVVVVGYGTQQRRDVTGSIASIAREELQQVPVSSFAYALQARAAGVLVNQASAAPGGGISVTIRGGNSVLSGNQPLYVIDGFPVYNDNNAFSPPGSLGLNRDALAALNPGDIESIEVLKDASATAIYGSRGANGVVLITTRRGKEGQSRVEVSSYYGIQQVARKLPLLNAEEFALLANEGYQNDGKQAPFADPAALGEGTDWQEEIFRLAPVQDHQLSFLGGNDNTRYALSGNFFRQEGIIIGSAFTRGSFRANLDRTISRRFRIGSSFTVSRTADDQTIIDTGASGSFAGVTTSALTMPPTFAVRDENGNYIDNTIAGGPPVGNPVALAREPLNRLVATRLIGNFFADYNILEKLTLRVSLGGDYSNGRRDTYLPSTTRRGRGTNGNASIANREVTSWLNENTLTYAHTAGPHQLNVLTGFTLQGQSNTFFTASSQGFTSDAFETDNLGVGSVPQVPQSGRSYWTLVSGLGRINYSFLGRYLLTVTARADGSSRFGTGNKWGFFPSVAAAWRLSDEAFLKGSSLVSDLKLRTSYGLTGNQEIGQFQSLAALNAQNYVLGNRLVSGIGPTRVANPDLRWETTAQFDVGIDAGLWNNRLTFTADYYYKRTRDLLLQVTLPTFSGFGSSLQNTGTNENQGLELALQARLMDGPFKWTLNGNYSLNRNRLLSLGRSNEFPSGPVIGGIGVNNTGILRVGEVLGNFYGYVADGIFQSQPEIDAHRAQPTAKPGDIRYRDLNNDGALTFADQTIIGSPQPDYYFGLGSSLSYKGFDFNFLMQGVVGNEILNIGRFELEALNSANSQLNTVLDRWRPDNPSNSMPRATTTASYRLSSRQVEDGSFLRLRNVTIGYSLPTAAWKWKGIRTARIYLTGQNLFTLTRYLGYDPEVNTFFGTDNLHLGIDYGTYPRARTYLIGINVEF